MGAAARGVGGAREELRGAEFDLTVGETAVNLTGRAAVGTVVNGSLPGPVLRWREGEPSRCACATTLRVETAIHWHGICCRPTWTACRA